MRFGQLQAGPVGFSALINVWLIVALSLVGTGCNLKSSAPGRFVERWVEIRGVTYRYQVFVPSTKFDGKRPLVVFLHGKGEVGYDGKKPVEVGLGPYIRTHASSFPAIVIFPQAPDNTQWGGEVNQIATAAIDAASKEFKVDSDRVYLTGLSMGGLGTWLLAMEQPNRFAAIVPVCTSLLAQPEANNEVTDKSASEKILVSTDPLASKVAAIKHIPTWIFHGGKDDLVPPAHARLMHMALKAAGARDVHYTEFPSANHNCWDPAYSHTPELWSWVFAQHRG